MNTAIIDIERTALEALHKNIPEGVCLSLGISGKNIGAGFASIVSALPSSAIVLNRMIGVGHGKPESKKTIAELVEAYREAGVERYFIHIHPDAEPREIGEWLIEKGLEKTRSWQKFCRGEEAVAPISTDLSIRKINANAGNDLASILCDAFDLGDEARPWIALLPNFPGWHVFMAYDGDTAAGTGAVFIDGETAWMDFGATSPQFRRRGSQSSLLRHRVQFALERGCTRMFTCTGEAVPGDPQHSYSNIQKAGFVEDYVRANYAPPKK